MRAASSPTTCAGAGKVTSRHKDGRSFPLAAPTMLVINPSPSVEPPTRHAHAHMSRGLRCWAAKDPSKDRKSLTGAPKGLEKPGWKREDVLAIRSADFVIYMQFVSCVRGHLFIFLCEVTNELWNKHKKSGVISIAKARHSQITLVDFILHEELRTSWKEHQYWFSHQSIMMLVI